MKVLNVHHRDLSVPPVVAGTLIDALSGPADVVWPRDRWPAIKFDRGLQVGASGGHGPIRYFVETYAPGTSITFRFTGPKGYDGTHSLFVEPAGSNSRLVHRLVMTTSGWATFHWSVVIRPLHDALIEDALDNAAVATAGRPSAAPWSLWVRTLRWGFRMIYRIKKRLRVRKEISN